MLWAMAISNELLDILACPDCKGDLKLGNGQKSLDCTKCGENFDIKEGIPVLAGYSVENVRTNAAF